MSPIRPAATHDPPDPAPQRPLEPEAGECCGEGCARCVYDIYEDALERYQAALAAWQARQSRAGSEHQPPGSD